MQKWQSKTYRRFLKFSNFYNCPINIVKSDILSNVMSNQHLTFELVWHISSKALYLTWIYDNEKSHFHVKFTASKLSNYAILKTAENECEILQSRSSRLKGFCKKGVLKNFAKFRPHVCNFIKKETLAQVLSCEFCKISKNTFSYRKPPVATSEKAQELYFCCCDSAQNVKFSIKDFFSKCD